MNKHWFSCYIYIIVCYCAITIGYLIISGVGYYRLKDVNKDIFGNLVESGKLQIVEKDSKEPHILRYGFSYYYYWPYTKKLFFLFLTFSPILFVGVYIVLSRLEGAWKRGFLLAILFILSIMLPMLITETFRRTATIVLAASFLFGALFWWTDTTFILSDNFYNSLNSVIATKESVVEKIAILYKSKNTVLLIVYGVFIFISSTMGLAITQILIEDYEIRSVCSLHVSYLVFLIALGCSGLFGGVAIEISREIRAITKALGKK